MDFCSERFEDDLCHVAFLRVLMDICFGTVPIPPPFEIRENPEFHDVMSVDKSHCPRCLILA